MTNAINDMELMRKMMLFVKKTRMEMGGRGMPGMGGRPGMPGMDGRPGMPGMDGRPGMPPGRPPHEGHGDHGGSHGPHGGPHGRSHGESHGPHGRPHDKRPPLSREHLLVLISQSPEGIRQKEIAEKVGINQSSTSELINKLEATGYIERKVDPNDRRATLLFLTDKGQARAAEVEDERKEMFEGLFDKLSDEEKSTLSDLLDKLLQEN